ncbi:MULTISPECIES: prenyltransferase/squalene oxidase repeat-containing protein [unclassified Thermoactinomyces]|jgi:sporulenol synthase|uniref:terpene cyclase/mutase family protein n=1 Tax=unclassified Thermoactinomyces TaxID=2634588 RepID=UPI0018DCE746|nr:MULTISPECIES: prenyltransferase/squalene oxidase repeat-containing protein [unclassified Thermoactinomyces]MBH8597625.1 squalene--hopene cyclase [Thermoactinomyces sp. CICC 10523]MBH8606500.1 squalene--hopene cyclase [Thermoactinomyces sp. CICC 10521]
MHGEHIDRAKKWIGRLSDELLRKQSPDGSWRFCFESGVMCDSFYLLLNRVLKRRGDPLEPLLIERILSRQTGDGTWKLYEDEPEGNLSTTVDACLALLYAKVKQPDDPAMRKAREYIMENGGAGNAGSLTKVVLALLSHFSWNNFIKLPVEFFLLPPSGPISFFDFVGYTRVHLAPILIAADREYATRLDGFDEVEEWLPVQRRSGRKAEYVWTAEQLFPESSISSELRRRLHERALRWGESFMLSRVEKDGTLYSYMTTTFLMIFALLSLGYSRRHPVIQKAMNGLAQFAFPLGDGTHLQETTSTVWDTSLILHVLQEAGVGISHPAIKRGLHYLKSRQQTSPGDWSIKNPYAAPGGWGFSDLNTINPDVDDTSSSLSALAPSVRSGRYRTEWDRGVRWLISMQNNDGGWPAFEKNTNKRWLRLMPYPDGKTVWGDPSSADLTGRTLRFFGQELGWTIDRPEARRAWSWFYHNQKRDGSWFGRWGVTFIYGTWAAITGLTSVGVPPEHRMIQKGKNWLLSKQKEDGGWGESCASDVKGRFVSLPYSTAVQTAWALDALIACHDRPTPEIEKGMERMFALLERRGREWTYPVGAGLAGQFYVYYHSYPYVWPLKTLAHYVKKYGK